MNMWSSKWTGNNSDSFTSKIRIYDAGEYVGFLYGDVWRCWCVKGRRMVDGVVTEELIEMPEGWAPFRVYSEEEYPAEILLDGPRELELRIPGWTVKVQQLSSESQRPLERGLLQREKTAKEYSKTTLKGTAGSAGSSQRPVQQKAPGTPLPRRQGNHQQRQYPPSQHNGERPPSQIRKDWKGRKPSQQLPV